MVKKKTAATSPTTTAKGNLKDFFSDMSKNLYSEYRHVFDSFSEEQKGWLAALIDTELRLNQNINGYSFKPTPGAHGIFSGIVGGALPENFDLYTLKQFLVDNELPIRSDWETRLKFMATSKKPKATGKKAGQRKRRPVKAPTRKLIVHYLNEKKQSPQVICEIVQAFEKDILENGELIDSPDICSIETEVATWETTKNKIISDRRYIADPEKLRGLQSLRGVNSATIEAFKDWDITP